MDDTIRDLLEKLNRLEWLLHRQLAQTLRDHSPMAAPYRGQGRILSLLRLTPEISQNELANILDIRPQSLGELLAKLERRGYITRTPSTTDRRAMDIRLTEAGRAAADLPDEPADLASAFDCLTDDEQAKLGEYLERLIAKLEQQLAAAETDFPRGPRFDRRGFGHASHHGRGGPSAGFRGFGHFYEGHGWRPDAAPADEE